MAEKKTGLSDGTEIFASLAGVLIVVVQVGAVVHTVQKKDDTHNHRAGVCGG